TEVNDGILTFVVVGVAEVRRAEPLFARYSGEFGPKTSSRCCGWRVRHLGWPVVVADTFRIERPGTLLDASFELPDALRRPLGPRRRGCVLVKNLHRDPEFFRAPSPLNGI